MSIVKAAFPATAEWQLIVHVDTITPLDQHDTLWHELTREVQAEQMARYIRDLQPEGVITASVFEDQGDGSRRVLFERACDFLEPAEVFSSAAS